MDQIFYAPEITADGVLPEEESKHCVRVMRLREGDRITVTDGKGFLYEASLVEAHPKHCRVETLSKTAFPKSWKFGLHVAVAPTKNIDRTEWFVEKATEIGIDKITFINCRHSERRNIKLERLEKIAASAMKQSQKAILPQIDGMMDFECFLKSSVNGTKMIAHCADGEKTLIQEIYPTGGDAAILIGPEGDFSESEIIAAVAQGYAPISLGESRLRTETAALASCHIIHVLNQFMP